MSELSRHRPSLLSMSVTFVAFLVLAVLAWTMLKLEAQTITIWMFWLPAGVAYAAIWLLGAPALIPLILAGTLTGIWIAGNPLLSLLSSLGAPLAALLARHLLLRLGVTDPLADPRSLFRFILIACLLAPMISATIGVLGYLVVGIPVPFGAIWLTWWVGEATGVLLMAPALLTLRQLWQLRLSPARWFELVLLLASVLILWSQLFLLRTWPEAPPVAFLAVLPLIWVALRFPVSVVAWCVMLEALLAALSTRAGVGLFARPDAVEATIYLNAFVAAITGVGLTLGCAMASQRKLIDELRQSEALMAELTETGTALVWISDIDGRISYRNHAWASVTGGSGATTLREWNEQVHADDRARVVQQFERSRLDGTGYELECRFVGDDGRLRWLFDSGRPRFDDAGNFLGFIGSTFDITARKRSEALLAAQAAVLRSLSFNIPLERLLHDIAQFVDAQAPDCRCAILLADTERGVLRHGAGPKLPDEYLRHIDGLAIGEGIGACGTAAARRMAVTVTDVYTDPLFISYRPVLPQFPWLRACWSMPFSDSRNELLGVISLYCEQPRAPGTEEQELLQTSASLAAIVVQRSREAQRLRESEASLRITFEQAAVGVAEIGVDGRMRRVNLRYCEIAGRSEAELMNNVGGLTHPDDMPIVLDAHCQLLAGRDNISFEQRYLHYGGEVVWVRVWWSLVRDGDGSPEYFIAVVEDISENKRAEAEIERLALYDTLTDLPNRRLFLDGLNRALHAAQRGGHYGALLFIDLDHFKHLNDARGHHAGDMLLRQVAQRLRRSSREGDTVARLGGDEFVILLEDIGDSVDDASASAGAVAEKVRQALVASFELEDGAYEHHVFASIGVTLFPKADSNSDTLLKEADTAMYRAKAAGRNKICFYAPEMQLAAELRLSLERDLRAAIGTDQLFLLLQPQVHIDGEIACAEALLRWNHPQRGAISPTTFIPVAEESGLIVPLGEWVLAEAARLTRELDGADNEVEIAVNVSPRQFGEADFVERVGAVIAAQGGDPRRLLLEITEGVVMADVDDAIVKMSALKQMGIRLSIDDFGVGYSSLSYLKRLPMHELKIDRTFVSDLPGDSNDVVIVDTILAMARHLQLDVVAEGVETEAQYTFLKARGCRFFQGWHIGMPEPAAAVMPLLRAARHYRSVA